MESRTRARAIGGAARLATLLAVGILGVGEANAEPLPAPDPRRGERPDARTRGRLPALDVALAVPRVVLTPPRLLLGVLAQVVGGALQLNHRYYIAQKFARLFTSADGLVGVRPIVRFYSSFSPQGGLAFFDRRSLGPSANWGFSLVAAVPQLVIADIGVERAYGQRLRWRLSGTYVRRDDLLFVGVGLASSGSARPNDLPRSRYGIDAVELPLELDVRFNRRARLRVAEVWAWRRYHDGRDRFDPPISRVYCQPLVNGQCLVARVDPAQVPGFHDDTHFFRTDVDLTLDWRDRQARPTRGLRLETGVSYARGVGADTGTWVRGRAKLIGALSLGSDTRVLLLSIGAQMIEPIGDRPVPFTELVTLGGPDDLRGFPLGRFRDLSSVMVTLEYRWAIWMWMDAALFADWGGTFGRRFDGFAFDRMVPDVGLGVRLRTRSRFLMRAYVAYGFGEGVQLMFATSTGL